MPAFESLCARTDIIISSALMNIIFILPLGSVQYMYIYMYNTCLLDCAWHLCVKQLLSTFFLVLLYDMPMHIGSVLPHVLIFMSWIMRSSLLTHACSCHVSQKLYVSWFPTSHHTCLALRSCWSFLTIHVPTLFVCTDWFVHHTNISFLDIFLETLTHVSVFVGRYHRSY